MTKRTDPNDVPGHPPDPGKVASAGHPPDPGVTVPGLDPGVVRTVEWLRKNGFMTTDSGDGQTKPSEARTLDFAHVFMRLASPLHLVDAADRLAGAIEALRGSTGGVLIEATYSPLDGIATLALLSAGEKTLDAVLFGQ